MENGVGRISTLRSLVRPVSPLSRMQKPLLPGDVDTEPSSRRAAVRRSRSRSPMLASTVHLLPPRTAVDQEPYAQPAEADSSETRRIIVRRPDMGYSDLDTIDSVHRSRSDAAMRFPASHLPTVTSAMTFGADESRGGVRKVTHSPEASSRLVHTGVDRAKTCPILVRMSYTTNGRHTSLSEYDKGRFPRNEIQFNTWIDCSLREMANEVRDVYPLANRRGTRLHFVVIYPDQRGTYRRRELGVVISGLATTEQNLNHDSEALDMANGKKAFNLTDDSAVTLLSKRFHIGDYVDVAITEHVPGTLGGWTSGRRPLGPTPVSARAATNLI